MAYVNSFTLQYGYLGAVGSNANFLAFSSSDYEMIITEAKPLSPQGSSPPPLSDFDVQQLQAQGRKIIGYVDIAATDHLRGYWQADGNQWTSDGTDTGALTANAPQWLVGHSVIAADPVGGGARYVSFWMEEWKNIVKAQIIELVQRGYDGVFLDDTGAYYYLATVENFGGTFDLAARMANFIAEIADAVHQINPSAIIVTNSDPYMPGAAGVYDQNARSRLLSAVDYHLLENKSISNINDGLNPYNGIRNLLILDSNITTEPAGDPTPQQSWGFGSYYGTTGGLYDQISPFVGNSGITGTEVPGGPGVDTLFGNALADDMAGQQGNDILYGGSGNDWLDGGTGNDTMYGENGDDVFIVDSISDIAIGGNGIDEVRSTTDHILGSSNENLRLVNGQNGTGNALANIMRGNATGSHLLGLDGNDQLFGNLASDTLEGGNGNDRIFGGGASDNLKGDAGDDALYGGAGDDNLFGGNGADLAYGDAGVDVFSGGDGIDTFSGGDGDDRAYGGNGDDSLAGGTGQDQLNGDAGIDVLAGGDDTDILNGGTENDRLYGQNGADILIGGLGDDLLTGGADHDTLYGGAGNDNLSGDLGDDLAYGDAGVDVFSGGDGIDTFSGGDGDDRAYGGNGDDSLAGGNGVDQLNGEAGVDVLAGGDGADILNGGTENDRLYGQIGTDILIGGLGADQLTGGTEADTFRYSYISEAAVPGVGAPRETILDFSHAQGDLIDLSLMDANSTAAGNQAFSNIIVTAFTNTAGQLRYTGGILSGDVNGDSIADFQIGITGSPALVAADFLL